MAVGPYSQTISIKTKNITFTSMYFYCVQFKFSRHLCKYSMGITGCQYQRRGQYTVIKMEKTK